MDAVVEIEIPARLEYLATVRRLVREAATLEEAWPRDRLADLVLAVSEACTNAIEAHEREQRDERVVVRCHVSGDVAEVTVKDHGHGFDEGALLVHPPASHPDRLRFERGLGIPLMRMLADESDFRPTAAGTCVRLLLRRRA